MLFKQIALFRNFAVGLGNERRARPDEDEVLFAVLDTHAVVEAFGLEPLGSR